MRRTCAIFTVLLLLTGTPAVAAVPDAVVRIQQVVGGLAEPVLVTHAGDSSGRLFIVEQHGKIRIFKSGQLLETPFLDLSPLVDYGGEKGLLGLAFHPNYRVNGRLFVNYTRTAGQLRTVVAEYRVSTSNPDVADPTEKLILTFDQPFANHNGGMLAFGSDGYLYIGTGDGGSAGDPQNNGQRLDTLLGKILRVDIDGASPYSIPTDNPMVGRSGARGEIWAYGLRNPWRFSFDRVMGRLFAGDVGQNSVEEVDIIMRGGNYGWRIMEGNNCFPPTASICDRSALVIPIATYVNPTEGQSVTGGYVYRGPQETPYRGTYFFADFVKSHIWALTENSNATWTRREVLNPGLSISSFGEDQSGELYLVHLGGVNRGNGAIYRMLFGSTGVFPQVADGGGYTTTFTIGNPNLNSSQGTLRFFQPDGSPWQVTLSGLGTASSFTLEIPAGGTRLVQTSGSASSAVVGSALLETSPPAGAVATFRSAAGGKLGSIAGVLNSGFLTRATVPLSVTSSANTGVAITNPGTAPVNVRLVLLNRDGTTSQFIDLSQLNPLPPKGQIALFVTEMGFQDAAALADGSLQVLVQGSGEVAVVSLVQEQGLITVVPVIPKVP
ncbi:MAG TPA: PQQ-dependent sugar dehydrogenase [Acidobacteriota bacterium]|jgi:glucose/arabinose dehydrogenase